jgi:hypothetical protein
LRCLEDTAFWCGFAWARRGTNACGMNVGRGNEQAGAGAECGDLETVSGITSPFWGFPYSVVWYKMPEIPEIWNESA